jgi:Flp pilus assembly protein TadG|tara:strand:+ start:2343 stop:2534 length:192 start_codon:yes stop_codon:yes gene_type:complete
MAVGDISITVVPVLSTTSTGDKNILTNTTLLAQYINENRPANHIVADVSFRGPRPIVTYRQTS